MKLLLATSIAILFHVFVGAHGKPVQDIPVGDECIVSTDRFVVYVTDVPKQVFSGEHVVDEFYYQDRRVVTGSVEGEDFEGKPLEFFVAENGFFPTADVYIAQTNNAEWCVDFEWAKAKAAAKQH